MSPLSLEQVGDIQGNCKEYPLESCTTIPRLSSAPKGIAQHLAPAPCISPMSSISHSKSSGRVTEATCFYNNKEG